MLVPEGSSFKCVSELGAMTFFFSRLRRLSGFPPYPVLPPWVQIFWSKKTSALRAQNKLLTQIFDRYTKNSTEREFIINRQCFE